MIKDLVAIANSLDKKGFKKEADFLDKIIKLAKEDVIGPPLYPEDEESLFDDFEEEADDESKSNYYDRFMDLIMIRLVQNMYGDSLENLSFEKDVDEIMFDRLDELDEVRSKKGDTHIIDMYRGISEGDPEAEALISLVERLRGGSIEERLLMTPAEPILASNFVNSLIKLSNHLDSIGHNKEADFIDSIIKSAKKKKKPKKKPTKKQLKALDLDGDEEITEKDFKLLGKKNKKSKKSKK